MAIFPNQLAIEPGDSLHPLRVADCTLENGLCCLQPSELPYPQLASLTGESNLPESANTTGETSANCHLVAKLTNGSCELHVFHVKKDTM